MFFGDSNMVTPSQKPVHTLHSEAIDPIESNMAGPTDSARQHGSSNQDDRSKNKSGTISCDIITHRIHDSITCPARRYYLEPPQISTAELYHSYIETQKELGTILPREGSTLYSEVHEAVKWILSKSDVSKCLSDEFSSSEQVEFDILRSPAPTAFIIHGHGISKPHIFISTQLIRDLLTSSALKNGLRQGHFRFILGHEIGHHLEGHYQSNFTSVEKKTENRKDLDPIEVKLIGAKLLGRTLKHLMLSRAYTRDQENRVDEISLRLCAQKNNFREEVNPIEGVEVLQHFAITSKKLEEDQKKAVDNKKIAKKRAEVLPWLAEKASATHPGIEGRVFRARGVVKQIEIENAGSQIGGRRWRATPKINLRPTDTQLNNTPLQESLLQLQAILDTDDNQSNRHAQILKFLEQHTSQFDIGNYRVGFDIIRHFMVFIPALLRVEAGCVPYEPYDCLKSNRNDRADTTMSFGMDEERAQHLDAAVAILTEAAQSLYKNAAEKLSLQGEGGSKERCELALLAYTSCAAIYTSQWSSDLLIHEIAPYLKKYPLEALALIDRYAAPVFETTPLSFEWIGRLLQEENPTEVQARGSYFLELTSRAQVDFRSHLLERIMSNEMLDEVNTVEVIHSFIHQCDVLANQSRAWSTPQIGEIIGNELNFWLENHFDIKNPLAHKRYQKFLSNVRDRSRPDYDHTDYILLELLKLPLCDDSITVQRRTKWLNNLLPAGKERDLALCILLENETNLFDYARRNYFLPIADGTYRGPDQKLGDKTTSAQQQSRPKSGNSHDSSDKIPSEDGELAIRRNYQVESYTESVEAMLPLFDCSWVTLSLKTGNISVYLGEDFLDIDSPRDRERAFAARRTQAPFHSPLLAEFGCTHSYALMAASDYDTNWVRYYLRNYLTFLFEKRLPQVVAGEFSFENILPEEEAIKNFVSEVPPPVSTQVSSEEGEITRLDRKLSDEASNSIPTPMERRRLLESVTGPNGECGLYRESTISGSETLFPEYLKAVSQYSKGEFRDYIVLRFAAWLIETQGINQLEYSESCLESEKRIGRIILRALMDDAVAPQENMFLVIPPEDFSLEDLKELLSLLRTQEDYSNEDTGRFEVGTNAGEKLIKLHLIESIYDDFLKFLRMKSGDLEYSTKPLKATISCVDLRDIATEVAKLALQLYYGDTRESFADFKKLPPSEKLNEICSLFIYPSSERDTLLSQIVREFELTDTDFFGSESAKLIYSLFASPFYAGELGEKIYNYQIVHFPNLISDFSSHLDLILKTHPQDSARRERRLKEFFDGSRNGASCCVRTWEERDRVKEALSDEKRTNSRTAAVARSGALQLLESAINELSISHQERVNTILWIAGFRGKSHLVNCYEAVCGAELSGVSGEVQRLTPDEKRDIIRTILAGPAGILQSKDPEAKQLFLDALFFSVFTPKESDISEENIRYFKAVYDTMLHYVEPERAAEFLGNFLVAHLEGDSFSSQVKTFFESFGFVGVKTAQYLVSSTSLIPDDLKEVLMDLTSRVEGPHSSVVFDHLEKTFGEAARDIVAEVGNRIGGGSLMAFYEVTLCDGRQGALGMLRPDIVYALPEDIALVKRLIETMSEAPELFNGKTIPEDLNENLVYMSLVETDLQRTARLQALMKQQIEDLSGSTPVRVPKIWSDYTLQKHPSSEGGEIKVEQISLTQGPFIFMEKASGDTLDIYEKKCRDTLPDGPSQYVKVCNRIADIFLDQIIHHGLVHCDLHPGNILVTESGEVTILDIGLSVELDPTVSLALQRYLKIALTHVDDNQSERGSSIVKGFFKRIFGISPVSQDQGKRWIRETLHLFEELLDEQWSEVQKEQAERLLWGLLTENGKPITTKLNNLFEISRRLSLVFPRELYYMVRAVAIMDYLWPHVDWSRQSHRIRQLGAEPSASTKSSSRSSLPESVAANLDRAAIILGKTCEEVTGAHMQQEDLKELIGKVKDEEHLQGKVQLVEEFLNGILSDIPLSSRSDAAAEIITRLLHDKEFQSFLGFNEVGEKMRKFFALSRGEREKSSSLENSFLSAQALPQGEARKNAYSHRFGQLRTIWKDIFYPGTCIRVVTPQGNVICSYVVNGSNSVNTPTEELEVSELQSDDGLFRSISRKIFSPSKKGNSSESFSWREVVRPIDGYIKKRTIQFEHGDSGEFDSSSAYLYMVRVLTQPERNHRTLSFRQLQQREAGEGSKNVIQVLLYGKWQSLEECRIQVGESEEEYLRFLELKRAELEEQGRVVAE